MRIVNVNLKEQTNFFSNHLLKEGKIFKGKIIEIGDGFVTLTTESGEIINGKTDILLTNQNNREIYLRVKSVYNNKIILSLLGDEEQNVYFNDSIKEILKMNGIKPNQQRVNVVKELINFLMPIDKKSIEISIKIYEKLVKLMNSEYNFESYTLKQEPEVLDVDISKLIVYKRSNNSNFNELSVKSEFFNDISMNKENIKYQDGFTNNIHLSKDKDDVKYELLSKAVSCRSEQELIKGVIFLLKNDIKVTINNICYLFDILNGNNILEEDFKELKLLLSNNKTNNINIKKLFKNLSSRIHINFNEFNEETLQKYFDKLKENIEILASLKTEELHAKNIDRKINEIYKKIDFLKRVNNHYGFYYIPFKVDENNFKENMLFLKKGQLNKNKNFKVFISLNTRNLGLVKTFCDVYKKNIKIDFEIKECYIDIFKREEQNLKFILDDKGFKNITIRYNFNKKMSPLELLNTEQSYNYLFDVRV